MVDDPYEWDEAKNTANRLKHGVGFELVVELDWSKAVFRTDRRFDYGEDRRLACGRIGTRGYAIVFVVRGDHVRVIIVRPAHEKELETYGI
jgi:uncharacterized DUF497 family protein